MKVVISLCAVITVFFFGYLIGSRNSTPVEIVTSSKVDIQIEEDDEVLEASYDEVPESPEEKSTKESIPKKKKRKKQSRKKKLEKGLKYFMDNAPFALVKSTFQKLSGDMDKAAFGGVYNKGEWGSDERKDNDRAIFDRSKGMFKKSFYFTAEGTLDHKGFEMPYNLLVNFNAGMENNKTPKFPENPSDIQYMMDFQVDTSGVGFGSPKFSTSMGAGIYSMVREGNQVFGRLYLYYQQTDSIFNEILYILVGLPTSSGVPNSIRLFNSKTKEWVEVTDELRWKAISAEEATRMEERYRGGN